MPARLRSSRPGRLRRVLVLTALSAVVGGVLTAPVLEPTASAAPTRAARTGTLTLSTTALVPAGDDVLATATSRPARPGSVVRLQVRRDGAWSTVAKARQGRDGVARLRLPDPQEGLIRLRAARSGTRAVSSPSTLVRVAPVEGVLPLAPGQDANRGVEDLDVSDDSRTLAYTTYVATETPGVSTVRAAVHDRLTGTTTMLPSPARTLSHRIPTVSPTGRYLAYVVALGRDNRGSDDQVLLADLQRGTTVRVPSPREVTGLDLSADGRWIAMSGSGWPAAAGLCLRDPSRGGERENDVYLLDRATGKIACPSSGLDGRLQGRVGGPRLSRDARVVSFGFTYRTEYNGPFTGQLIRWEGGRREVVRSPSPYIRDYTDRVGQLVVEIPRAEEPGDQGLYDVKTGTLQNLTASDDEGSFDAYISADGAFLYYSGNARNAAPAYPERSGPNPGCTFRREVATGTTTVAFCGTSRNEVAVSRDGRFIAADDDEGRTLTRFYSLEPRDG